MQTPAGQLLERVYLIDVGLQMRFDIRFSDVTYEEFLALCLLHSERNRKRDEEMKRAEFQAKADARKGGPRRG